MSKATDQCREQVEFLLELRSYSLELQSSLNPDLQDCGLALQEILERYKIIDRRGLE